MFVFVEDAAQALVLSYVQVSDLARVIDRRGQRMQRRWPPLAGLRPPVCCLRRSSGSVACSSRSAAVAGHRRRVEPDARH
ncbi:MAG: hypothetical protein JWP34_5078 [Massilia sp.]|nr:hypothetical protein [Massilia sp.]